MIIYLAGPRFSPAERNFNQEFARILERCYMPLEVILPRDGRAENYVTPEFAQRTYRFAVDAIDRSDAIVAILDGVSTDSGACIEMGYAKGKGKLVFGVRTDFRGGEDRGQNVMVSGTCTALIVRNRAAMTLEDLAEEVADVFAKYERSTAPACIPFQPIEVLERRSV